MGFVEDHEYCIQHIIIERTLEGRGLMLTNHNNPDIRIEKILSMVPGTHQTIMGCL